MGGTGEIRRARVYLHDQRLISSVKNHAYWHISKVCLGSVSVTRQGSICNRFLVGFVVRIGKSRFLHVFSVLRLAFYL